MGEGEEPRAACPRAPPLVPAPREEAMDDVYMRRALELAERGCGLVSPNPLVGAILDKDGEVVGHARGFGVLGVEGRVLRHQRAGEAEVVAARDHAAGELVRAGRRAAG